MSARGFDIPEGDHPIVPDHARRRRAGHARWPSMMLDEGIYVIGFSYPVVPKGKARIRVQISAAHTREDLDKAMDAFASVRDSQ